MSVLLQSKTVRLALNAASLGGFVDQLTGGAVSIPKADARFEVGVFYHRVNTAKVLVDLGNWVSLTCTLKNLGAGGAAPAGSQAAVAERTVLVAAMNAALTVQQWDDVAAQHAAFDFTEAEINAITGAEFWCVFTALLVSGKAIPVAFGKMSVVEDGYGIADPAAVVDGTAFTKAQALALFGLRERNGITARTGGGAAALDGIVTAAGAWATGDSVRTRTGALGGREEWILEAGADAEAPDDGIVRPDDFHAATNARVWRQIL
jgi:hypothetical protein